MRFSSMTLKGALVAVALHAMVARSSDADIDVDAARSAYNAQQTVVAHAQQNYDLAYSKLRPYLDALSNAQSNLSAADGQVRRATNEVNGYNAQLQTIQNTIAGYQSEYNTLGQNAVELRRNIATYSDQLNNLTRQRQDAEREIARIHQDINREQNNAQWVCTYVDHGFEEHSGGHRATRATQSEADAAAKAACKAAHDQCNFSGCERTSSRLEQLKRDLQAAESRRDSLNNQIQTTQNSLRDAQYNLDTNTQRQTVLQQQISNAQIQYSQVSTSRDQAMREYNDAVSRRNMAANNVAAAQQDVNRETPAVNAAKATLDRESATAQQLYAYLNQVIANYQAEQKAAVSLGQIHGSQDGSKEAGERSKAVATDDGHSVGADKGKAKGAIDAAERSYVMGYAVGRKDGATLPETADRYKIGITTGHDLADRKAASENLPAGYNDSFAKKLNETPAQTTEIDITDKIPTDPGSNGRDLRNLHRDAVAVAEPAYTVPFSPTPKVPAPTTPAVQIPVQDNRYSHQPCDGLRRAEFVTTCKQNYENSYSVGFKSAYKSTYESVFSQSFTAAATPTYNDAFSQDNAGEIARGKGVGAEHLGVLNGYAERFQTASKVQYAQGAVLLSNDLASGHLVVVRGITLADANGDGALQPGEKVKLSAVIDNLGQLSTPMEKLRINVKNLVNAKSLSVALRGLPALAAATRTTLKGVVSAESSAVFTGDEVRLEGAIELQQDDGTFVEVSRFSAKQTTHFPIELTAIDTTGPLPMGQWTKVSFKFQNTTSSEITNAKFRLSTKPKNVDVYNPNGIAISKMAAGEVKTFDVQVQPGVWAGGAPVVFSAESLDASGQVTADQKLRKDLDIARDAKLTLLNNAGQPSTGAPIVVNAGSRVQFQTRFDFLATSQKGPFVIRYANASDPGITPVDSTVSTQLGYWSPGMRMNPVRFQLQVPASLKGKTAWAAIELDEGSNAIHMLQVWLDVR